MKEVWVEIFKSGTHIDSNGSEHSFTDEDLSKIESIYNNKLKENESFIAPVVKGHPVDNDPAFGWVESLKVKGKILFAKLKDLVPEFINEVKDGLYKKVSIALYPNLMLKHLGFLGAVPPAVKGLANVKFIEKEVGEMILDYGINENEKTNTIEMKKADDNLQFTILPNENRLRDKPIKYKHYNDDDFADPVHYRLPMNTLSELKASIAIFNSKKFYNQYSNNDQQTIASRLINQMEKFGIKRNYKIWKYNEINKISLIIKRKEYAEMETITLFIAFAVKWIADKTGDEEIATAFQADADTWVKENAPAEKMMPTPEGEPAPVTASEQKIDPEILELQNKVQELQRNLKEKENKSYCEKLISEGYIKPANEKDVMILLEIGNKSAELKFTENNKEKTATDVIKTFLESLPKNDLTKEFATNDKADKTKIHNKFGSNVNYEELELHSKVIEFQNEQRKIGRELDFLEAYNEYQQI